MFCYADDLGLLVLSKSLKDTAIAVKENAKAVVRWGRENALEFDLGKSELVRFSRSRNATESTEVRLLGDHVVKATGKAVRWLGVWLDPKRGFKHHLEGGTERSPAPYSRKSC